MRLSNKEIELIKESVTALFDSEVSVYLFGSRADEGKKGGDIDLYIEAGTQKELYRKKLRLKTWLEDRLYKPVDIVMARDKNRPIEKEATKGIRIL